MGPARFQTATVFLVAMALWLNGCTSAAPPTSTPAPQPTQPPKAAEPAKQPEAPKPAKEAESPKPSKPVEAPKAVAKPAEVKLAIPTKTLEFLPFYVGIEAGIFKEEGLGLSVAVIPGPTSVAALNSDQLDFIAPVGAALRNAVKGMPIKVIAFHVTDPPWELVGKPELTSVTELRGKVVGITFRGGSMDYTTRELLSAYGMDPEKDLTVFPASDVLAAMQSGSVDAGLLGPPVNAVARKLGFKKLDYKDEYLREQVLSGLATTDKKLKDNPDQVRRMLRGLLKSVRYTADRKQESVKVMIKEWDLEPELASASYDFVAKKYNRNATIREETVKKELERVKQETGMTEDVPLAKLMDMSLLDTVLKELGR
ncbi:MAG: ABC transporter substrate-binding protein [Chloroflexi bacterium]|nr:ABC transporter substrate-binding protein [Chloroflexota bacterium]